MPFRFGGIDDQRPGGRLDGAAVDCQIDLSGMGLS